MSQALKQKLEKYRDLKQILKETVETTRETLECDRVIVYSASDLPVAGVIAESVAGQYASLLGKKIKDPFLEGDYLEMYCYNMSLTIDNIYTSDINSSSIRELEHLGIKSIAVAPIYVDKKLLAFLVAHQCEKIQPWNLEAVNFLAEMASTSGEFLAKIGQTDIGKPLNPVGQIEPIVENALSLSQEQRDRIFFNLQDRLIQQLNLKDLLDTTVTEMRRLLECDRVLIFDLNGTNNRVIAESVAQGWTGIMTLTPENSTLESPYLEEDLNGKVRTWNNTQNEDLPLWYRQQLEILGVKAAAIAPIAKDGQIFGLAIAHQCSSTRSWQYQEINWITKIANRLATMLQPNQTPDNPTNPQQSLVEVQQQLEREKIWSKYFSHIITQIRQSLVTEDILQASVREIHQILQCDRVLVYALDSQNYGKIVAESVSPGWTKAIGKVIQDPCFEARYLEKYRDGRVRVWNDIYQSAMTSCHIEQLERLEVKANAVIPIISEAKLFGLLVTQQCSGSRQWQPAEIDWLQKIVTQVGYALDNASLLADARKLRSSAEREKIWTEYFTDAVQQIRQSLKTKDIYRASVREVRRILNCDRVLVYSLNTDCYGTIVAESVARGWTRGEGRLIKDPCFEARYLEKYRDGRVRVWNDIYESRMSDCYIEQLEQLEVKANLVVPIVDRGKLFGLLVAQQCSDTRQWQSPEINWLTAIANQVALALENARMQEQIAECSQTTQDILNRAATSSVNIQRAVQTTTAGLENLNHACQSFALVIENVKDLSKQLAQQSMGITRTINLSQTASDEQNTIVELSDRIFSLMQALFEATAKIDPLFESMKTEIVSQTKTLELESQQLDREVADFQTANQQLERVVDLNQEIANLIATTSDALESQIKNSTFTTDSVSQLIDITERVSEQSAILVESLSQLKGAIE